MVQIINTLPLFITLPLILLSYIFACYGAGLGVFLFSFKISKQPVHFSPATFIASAFLLGEGILAGLWILLALGGLFSIYTVGPILLMMVFVGVFWGSGNVVRFWKQIKSIWHEIRQDTWGWQFIGILVTLSMALWITSLGRPLFGDGSAFYFAFAKLIAYTKNLIPLPFFTGFTNIGLLGELHYAALMLLHSPEAARLFSLPTIVSGSILLSALGRQVGMGRRGQWLTLGMVFSSSAVIWLSGDGKVDLFGTALGIAAYYWAAQIYTNKNFATLLFTGLFSGYAIIGKLSYIPVLVPGIAFLVIWGYGYTYSHTESKKTIARSFLSGSTIILVGLAIAFTPHLIKNGILFNNPLSPLGSGGMGWMNQTWFSEELTRRITLSYPFALTYGSYWAQYGDISPLILAFLPLIFFLPRPKNFLTNPLFIITLAAIMGVGIWVIYRPSVLAPRYMLATLLILTLLPARAAEYVSQTEARPRILSFGIIIATSITLLSTSSYFSGLVFFPKNSYDKYLDKIQNECDIDGVYCTGMNRINNIAPPGARILHASYQFYWLREDLLQCTSQSDEYAIISSADQDNFWLEIYKKGFSFIFIEKSSFPGLVEKIKTISPPAWVKVTAIYENDNVSVYKIKYDNSSLNITPGECRKQNDSKIWKIYLP